MSCSRDIKKFGPSRSSRFSQGMINPSCCRKLFESQRSKPIIYRSSWEKKFIIWCESSNKIKAWGSECVGIPYKSAVDGRQHTYYPDFYIILNDDTKVIVEIKPKNQVDRPDPENQWAVRTYLTNVSKWRTVQAVCEKNDMKFWILTEETINKLK